MEEKLILVEFETSLNQVLSQTFQSTQRIKLTCFDVSNNYIVFGASSGGIYVFKRDPSEFLKLIPSKEGSAVSLLISPNEKNVAIASSKGLIIVLENFFVDLNLRYQVYSEHEGKTITCLKWWQSDLYAGDSTGKVSVISLSSLLAKAIFQTPSASLMNLDSSIVQIDAFSKYILVSTQTRVYLCDTQKEQYRQIGKKLRDGPFGACFYNIPSFITEEESFHTFKGLFETVKEDETFGSSEIDVKIYCSRPGTRLWEADFSASVLVTHQFRESLSKFPSELIQLQNDSNALLKIETNIETEQSFNFRKLFVLGKLLLTFENDGIYIFDPIASNLIYWTNKFKHICDVKIVNSLIYIWQGNKKMNIISLMPLEDLVVKSLLNKQYQFCGELCTYYSEDILKLLRSSSRIHLVSALKNKLKQFPELLEKLDPILKQFEENQNRPLGKRLRNGIFLVDNDSQIDKNGTTHVNGNQNVDNSKDEINFELQALYKQYKLNKTHSNVKTSECTKMLAKLTSDSILSLLALFEEYVQKKENEDAHSWCQLLYLDHSQNSQLSNYDENSIKYLKTGFMELNKSDDSCTCGFPLPRASLKIPKYYSLGEQLITNEETSKVPYMHIIKLKKISSSQELQENLPLLIQYNSLELIKQLSSLFTYDSWDTSLKYLLKLKEQKCLNCGESISIEDLFTWTQFCLIINQTIGAENTINLLKRHAKFIPKGELNAQFFQACIFTTVLSSANPDSSSQLADFVNNIGNSSPQFDKLIGKYLKKKHLEGGSQEMLGYKYDHLKCVNCDLPVNVPILNEFNHLICGHVSHNFCEAQNMGNCRICFQGM